MKLCDLSIGILAGGKSSRMGSNKAELAYRQGSFLEHILSEAGGFSRCLISVDQIGKYRWLSENSRIPLKLVEDELSGYGPVEGIYQILKNAETDACLVAATDMPGLTGGFLRDFAEEYGGEDCLVLEAGGAVEPLCSIYSRRCIPVLENFRREGIRKPRLLFEQVNTRYLKIEDMGYDASVVSNINTPEQYRRFMEGI